jgi:hypothetical protein
MAASASSRAPGEGWVARTPSTWLASADAADVTGQVIEASGGVLAVAEGWHRGPSIEAVDAPQRVGPMIRELLADARPRTLFHEIS